MSEEPLQRSRETIENARHAADRARETEPFHRDDVDSRDRDETEAAVAAPRAESDVAESEPETDEPETDEPETDDPEVDQTG